MDSPVRWKVRRLPLSLHGRLALVTLIAVVPLFGLAVSTADPDLRRRFVELLLIAAVLSTAAFLVTHFTIQRAVIALLAATRRLSEGGFDIRLEPHRAMHELDSLATSFNVMAASLRDREAALQRSEGRYRSLVENAPYGLFRLSPEGRIIEANPAFAKLVGYPDVSSLLAVEAQRLEDELGVERATLRRQLEGDPVGVELELARRDGQGVLLRGAAKTVREASGRVLGQDVVVEDFTEQKKLEEQLRQSQKLESIGRIAGSVAHDFNNLLSVILMVTELVQERLEEPLRSELGEVREAGTRAKALTQQLLAFSRRQALQPRAVDLNETIEALRKLLDRMIKAPGGDDVGRQGGEHVSVVTLLEPTLGPVLADGGQLEQVVLNLALNARDAISELAPRGGTTAGGKVVIQTRNVELRATELHEGVRVPAGRYVCLTVTDNGVGMDANTKAHLFEPFFTTKQKGKGTGLGLSTVYGIVKQSGGSLWLESEPGRGTTFTIYLPRLDVVLARPAAAEGEQGSPGTGQVILLVEDDDGVRAAAQRVLSAGGYEVLPAKSGEAALEQVPENVALLLTDVVLPRMSGLELAQKLRLGHPSLKVLFTSGHLPEKSNPLSDASPLLQKPLTAAILLQSVREALLTCPAR